MPIYGVDISCGTDLDPLLQDIADNAMMAQVCVRRLFCRKGSLLSDPIDNTLDARDFISKDVGANAERKIQALCQQALLGDERIFSCIADARFAPTRRTLTLSIKATGANGPFALTISVDKVTVQLLKPV